MNDNDPRIRRIVGPTIKIFGGSYYDFLDPESSRYTIEDVAHALSQICRFNGHTDRFYSVAQHSVLASFHVAPGYEYDALMHDAPEFVVGDVTSPLGSLLPDYKALKKLHETAVCRRFGVTYPFPEAVHEIDIRMLRTEQEQLMDAANDDWGITHGVEPIPVRLAPWSPAEAKDRFLDRYHQLRAAAVLAA